MKCVIPESIFTRLRGPSERDERENWNQCRCSRGRNKIRGVSPLRQNFYDPAFETRNNDLNERADVTKRPDRSLRGLAQEPQIWIRKTTYIRENSRQIRVGNTKPGGHGRGKLFDRGGRDPTSLSCVIRAVNCQRWKCSIQAATANRTAKDKLMIPPTMIGPVAVRAKSATEI